MSTVEERARIANGRSRACSKCRFGHTCPSEVLEVCTASFVEGFKHGYADHLYKMRQKHERILSAERKHR